MPFQRVFRRRPRNAQMPPKGAEHGGDRKRYAGSDPFAPLAAPTFSMAVIPITRALCRGTPVIHRGILEGKADFYYLRKGIGGIRELIGMERTHRRVQGAIITFSVAYNVAAAGLAMGRLQAGSAGITNADPHKGSFAPSPSGSTTAPAPPNPSPTGAGMGGAGGAKNLRSG